MPAKKPANLSKRHATLDEKAAKVDAEAALTPTTLLTVTPPAALKKHAHASRTWKRLMGLYYETEGTIITAFDENILTKYCLLEEECLWLEAKRKKVDDNAESLDKQLSKIKPKGEDMKTYLNLLMQYNALTARVQGLDARLDGKRKLLLALEQSLYLTPRSRAGVAPPAKPTEGDDGFGSEFDQ